MFKKLSPYNRYYDLSVKLNPFSWFSKPSYYRFDWQRAKSLTREGQIDFLMFSFNWYRDLR